MKSLKSHKTRISLIIVVTALVALFSAAIIFLALQPPSVKVEYWLTRRIENEESVLVSFQARLMLQGSDNIILNAANFTLNNIYHTINTGYYPFTLNRDEVSDIILVFEIPIDTVTYALSYQGTSNSTFSFSQVLS